MSDTIWRVIMLKNDRMLFFLKLKMISFTFLSEVGVKSTIT